MVKERTKKSRKTGSVKVITYGTFDLFHEGHRRILERAKALGDYLIVGVTTDHFDEARGKLNTVDSIITRIENVKATGYADEIIVEETQGQKFRDIKKYRRDVCDLSCVRAVGKMNDERIVGWSPFCGVDLSRGVPAESVRAEPVNRLGGKSYKSARSYYFTRFFQSFSIFR